jgi:hypothetical protein
MQSLVVWFCHFIAITDPAAISVAIGVVGGITFLAVWNVSLVILIIVVGMILGR